MMQAYRWMAALLLVWTLGGCDEPRGGGGGGEGERTYEPTHDRSNPVTREQEHSRGRVPLYAVPEGGQATFGEGLENVESVVVARDGRPTLRVDVNSADVAALMQVPGMSVNLAEAIVNNRPYRNREDLIARIPNLRGKFLSSFEQYLTYGPAQAP